MSNSALYQKAIENYGRNSQVTVAIEELAELIKELCKDQHNCVNLEHLAEELADVEIMCEQLRYIFEVDSEVEVWKDFKLARLANRLK